MLIRLTAPLLRSAIVASAATALLVAAPAMTRTMAAEAEGLASHRAVYDLSLLRGGGDVVDAEGRIVYEFIGNACEGYTTTVRQLTTLIGDSGSMTLDTHVATFEEGDGSALSFRTRTLLDGAPMIRTQGEASIVDDGLRIALDEPRTGEIAHDERPAFPTEHILAILDAARQGDATLAMAVFDGGDEGDDIHDTFTVIGSALGPDEDGEFPQLTQTQRWRVTLSYFDRGEAGDGTPSYVAGFDLHENGVTTDLSLDFGDFALAGTMTGIEFFETEPCP
ncbi:MAG: cell envelope integrity EipB family protein [Salinarimonas sp.]|nr:cell envelope integrity EipB family protein [Salinarimonas sp.]